MDLQPHGLIRQLLCAVYINTGNEQTVSELECGLDQLCFVDKSLSVVISPLGTVDTLDSVDTCQ